MNNIFKDKHGKIIIAQKPNLPIIVWLITFIVVRIPIHETVNQLAEIISFGALFTWAWMELFSGVNIFRRILGGTVMISLLFLTLMTK